MYLQVKKKRKKNKEKENRPVWRCAAGFVCEILINCQSRTILLSWGQLLLLHSLTTDRYNNKNNNPNIVLKTIIGQQRKNWGTVRGKTYSRTTREMTVTVATRTNKCASSKKVIRVWGKLHGVVASYLGKTAVGNLRNDNSNCNEITIK